SGLLAAHLAALRLARLESAPWRARLVTGESLQVPQVLPGGDPALQPFGAPELPLPSPPPDGIFQPLTHRAADRVGGHAQRPWPQGTSGSSLSGRCDRAGIRQVQHLPVLSQAAGGTSADLFCWRPAHMDLTSWPHGSASRTHGLKGGGLAAVEIV